MKQKTKPTLIGPSGEPLTGRGARKKAAARSAAPSGPDAVRRMIELFGPGSSRNSERESKPASDGPDIYEEYRQQQSNK